MTFDQTGTQPRQQLLDTVSAALDAGVTLFDSADAYGPGDEKGAGAQGENERLIVSILDEPGVRDQVFLATKGGHVRTEGGGWATDSWRPTSRGRRRQPPAHGRRADLAVAAPPSGPEVSYDDVIGTLKEIADSGKVAHVGLSNANPQQIRDAHAVLGTPWSACRTSSRRPSAAPGRDRRVRRTRPGVPAVEPARRPLQRQGARRQAPGVRRDRGRPRRQRPAGRARVGAAQSPVVIPIPGAKRPSSITDSAAAADLWLTDDVLARLDAG